MVSAFFCSNLADVMKLMVFCLQFNWSFILPTGRILVYFCILWYDKIIVWRFASFELQISVCLRVTGLCVLPEFQIFAVCIENESWRTYRGR